VILQHGRYARFSDDDLRAEAAKANAFDAGQRLTVSWFRGNGDKTFIKTPSGHGAWVTFEELELLEANGMQWPPKQSAMHSIPIDPRHAAEQARGPKTYSEAVRALREVALTATNAAERRNAKRMLERLDAEPSKETKKMAKQTRAYSSPMGDIPSKEKKGASDDGKGPSTRDLFKVLRQSANDPKDPKRDQAKELLRLLAAYFDEDDDTKASDDDLTDKEVENAVSGHGRAKALAATSKVTRLSPYAAMLDEQMGLTARQGTRIEGSQLILSPGKQP
jgi:hypothetical protein